ncbi:ubiquitin-like small modifier protein 1 [Actinosynnema sp. NPDC020468]|uniref:ubiquitin-like small modifier protein 1 n=1 Tax=Actinosynnema sp. NPDC020468 TaxID=3154488 RepID=UPI0033E7342B
MEITVRLPAVLRPAAADQATLTLTLPEDATLGTALDLLATRYPLLARRLRDERSRVRRYVNIYLDGEDTRRLAGVETPLPAGATVEVIPSVAGG